MMGAINWGRVFLGGLLAGAVLAVLGVINWFFFEEQVQAAILALNPGFQLTPGLWAAWTLVAVLAGMAILWVYASIRPRYGPGPKTAAMAGAAVWFIAALADVAWLSLGFAPVGLLTTLILIYLVYFVVAAVAGAWAYKE
jgi:hypothetical protein